MLYPPCWVYLLIRSLFYQLSLWMVHCSHHYSYYYFGQSHILLVCDRSFILLNNDCQVNNEEDFLWICGSCGFVRYEKLAAFSVEWHCSNANIFHLSWDFSPSYTYLHHPHQGKTRYIQLLIKNQWLFHHSKLTQNWYSLLLNEI